MKTGCFKVKTATELMMNANSYASEFSPTATIASNGVIHFGKWAVEPNGDMTYDGWYIIQDYRLHDHNWILHLTSKAWIDWNEFIPAYLQALKNAGIQKVTIISYYK